MEDTNCYCQYAGEDESSGKWIFGAVNRDNSKLFVSVIESRAWEDLIPIIVELVPLHTRIISDKLATYQALRDGFYYELINKKVDGFAREEQENGHPFIVTVNHIENRWRWIRQLYREEHKTSTQHVQRVLNEAMYRFYCKGFLDIIKRDELQ